MRSTVRWSVRGAIVLVGLILCCGQVKAQYCPTGTCPIGVTDSQAYMGSGGAFASPSFAGGWAPQAPFSTGPIPFGNTGYTCMMVCFPTGGVSQQGYMPPVTLPAYAPQWGGGGQSYAFGSNPWQYPRRTQLVLQYSR